MPVRRIRLGTRTLALLVAAVVTLGACTPTTSTTTETTTTVLPPPRTVLRVGVETWPRCLNPLLCADTPLQQQILQHVLPGAYRIGPDNAYHPTAVLAEPASVEVVGDLEDGPVDGAAMTIVYRLNPEARWAGGMPITSSDFVGTWRAVMTTPGADVAGYELITGIDDRDPLVAVVSLRQPYGDWRELFGGSRNHLLQADAFGATTDLTAAFTDELPFSGGPYQLVTWSENEAVLARVDNSWDPARTARVDQIRYRPISISEINADAFDVLVPAADTTSEPPDRYEELTASTTRVLGVWFDQRSPLLQPDVHRRILAFALDRTELAQTAAEAATVAAPVDCLGWVPGVGPWCEAAAVDEFTLEPDLSRLALSAEGWVPDENGRLVRGGEVFSIRLTADPNDPAASAVADQVAAAIADLGIEVRRDTQPTQAWAATRSLENGFGVGVFSLDLGVGPGTPQLYDCSAGRATSVLAWCPQANRQRVNALQQTVAVPRRTQIVAALGRDAQAATAWVPLVQLADRMFVRTDRADAPEPVGAVGGPLAGLSRFTVND